MGEDQPDGLVGAKAVTVFFFAYAVFSGYLHLGDVVIEPLLEGQLVGKIQRGKRVVLAMDRL
jgi:hypothetical protein